MRSTSFATSDSTAAANTLICLTAPPPIVLFSCKIKSKLPRSGNSEAIVSLLIHQPHPLTFTVPVLVPTAPVRLHLELPRSVGEVVHLQEASSQECSVMVMGGHISFFGGGDLLVCSKLTHSVSQQH